MRKAAWHGAAVGGDAARAMHQTTGMNRPTMAGALAVASLCAGCCGSVDPTTWQGTVNYAFTVDASAPPPPLLIPDADAGSDAGKSGTSSAVIGASHITVTLKAFAPWVWNSFSATYCGSSTFSVVLGPSCELAADVVGADTNEGSASIRSGQTCTLDTPSGSFTVGVEGGSVAISGNHATGAVLDVLLDAPGANVEFQGNLR